jgi:hypothetical protein
MTTTLAHQKKDHRQVPAGSEQGCADATASNDPIPVLIRLPDLRDESDRSDEIEASDREQAEQSRTVEPAKREQDCAADPMQTERPKERVAPGNDGSEAKVSQPQSPAHGSRSALPSWWAPRRLQLPGKAIAVVALIGVLIAAYLLIAGRPAGPPELATEDRITGDDGVPELDDIDLTIADDDPINVAITPVLPEIPMHEQHLDDASPQPAFELDDSEAAGAIIADTDSPPAQQSTSDLAETAPEAPQLEQYPAQPESDPQLQSAFAADYPRTSEPAEGEYQPYATDEHSSEPRYELPDRGDAAPASEGEMTQSSPHDYPATNPSTYEYPENYHHALESPSMMQATRPTSAWQRGGYDQDGRSTTVRLNPEIEAPPIVR